MPETEKTYEREINTKTIDQTIENPEEFNFPQTKNLITQNQEQNIDSKEEPIDPVAEFNDLYNNLKEVDSGSIFFSNEKGELLELGYGVSVSHTNSDKQLYLINSDTGERNSIAYHPETNTFYQPNEGLYSEEGVYSEEKVQEILGYFRNIINEHPQSEPIDEIDGNRIDNQTNEKNMEPHENEQQKPQIIEQELDLVRNRESWQVLNPITTKEQAIQLVNYINSDENTKGLRLNVSKITNKEIAQELINSHKTLSIELSQNKEADINTDMLQILSNYQHPLHLYGFSTTKWTKEQIQNLQNYKGEDLLIGGTIKDQDLHLLSGIKTKLQLPLLDYHKINFEHFVDFQCKELILDNIHHLTKNDTQYLKQYIDQGGTLTFGVNHQSQYAREGGYDGIMNCFEGYNIRTNNDNIFYQITINKKDK